MRCRLIILSALAAIGLGACANREDLATAPSPPPPPPGSIAGSTAADRDGDGIVDGYYTADGIYHANYVPPPPPPPPVATRQGERG